MLQRLMLVTIRRRSDDDQTTPFSQPCPSRRRSHFGHGDREAIYYVNGVNACFQLRQFLHCNPHTVHVMFVIFLALSYDQLTHTQQGFAK